MKKMKILSLLIATTLVSANLIACTNTNNTTTEYAQQAQYPGTPSPDATTNQIEESTSTSNATKEDLELNTRIFTNYGFSVATKDSVEAQSVLVLKGTSKPQYDELIKQELINLIDDEYFNQVSPIKSIDIDDYHYSYKIVSQYIMTQLKIMTTSRPDLLAFDDIEEFIVNNIEITQEELNYLSTEYKIIKSTIKINDGGNDGIKAYFENAYEIYNIPFKNDPSSEDRFEVLYQNQEDREEEIQFIADTFILDTDAVEVNAENKSKFASVSFTSYVNQEYFPNELLIPYAKTSHFEDFDILDYIDTTFNNTVLSVFFSDYHIIENQEEYLPKEVNENTFDVLTKLVDVTNDDGSVTQEELILSIIHSHEDLGDFKTFIELKDINNGFDFYTHTYTKSEFDMINEIFNDIMQNYQIKLNNSAQDYFNMVNEMNQAFSME